MLNELIHFKKMV